MEGVVDCCHMRDELVVAACNEMVVKIWYSVVIAMLRHHTSGLIIVELVIYY